MLPRHAVVHAQEEKMTSQRKEKKKHAQEGKMTSSESGETKQKEVEQKIKMKQRHNYINASFSSTGVCDDSRACTSHIAPTHMHSHTHTQHAPIGGRFTAGSWRHQPRG